MIRADKRTLIPFVPNGARGIFAFVDVMNAFSPSEHETLNRRRAWSLT